MTRVTAEKAHSVPSLVTANTEPGGASAEEERSAEAWGVSATTALQATSSQSESATL